ncbi:Cyclic pyranopterin monophosphate synthase 1 [compost metagenome]
MEPAPDREFFVQISVTNRCNLSCRHCYRDVRTAFPDEYSTEELIGILHQVRDLAARLGREPNVLFSGGEPLSRPDLGLLVRVAQSLGIVTHLNTNGTLITPEMAAALKAWGILGVQVSLDGPTPETHDRIRGRGNFERALSGVRNLRAEGIEVMFKVTLMPGVNDTAIAPFYALANREGVRVLSFARLIAIGPGARLRQLTGAEYRAALDAISQEAAQSPFTRTEIRDAGFDRAFSLSYPHVFHSEEGISFMALDADGTAYAGRRTPIVLGNVRESSLEALWAHPVLEELRTRRITGKCAGCELFEVCGGGSRAAAYGTTGDYMAPDPHCWYEPGQGERLEAPDALALPLVG